MPPTKILPGPRLHPQIEDVTGITIRYARDSWRIILDKVLFLASCYIRHNRVRQTEPSVKEFRLSSI